MAIVLPQAINGTTISVQLAAANSRRQETIIQNDSSAPLFVAFGGTASPSVYTVKLYPDDVLTTAFQGQINGIWASAAGNARVTEVA